MSICDRTALARVSDELDLFKDYPQVLSAKGVDVERVDPYGFIIHGSAGPLRDRLPLIVTGLVHGDEVLGLEALNITLQSLLSGEKQLNESVGFLLCNIEAAKKGVRYVESDLNRSFLSPRIETLEQHRALEISKFLSRGDLVLDFHQTVEPTLTSFFIFEHDLELIQLAYALAPNRPIVTFSKGGFSKAGKTLTEFVSSNQKKGLTVEWSQKGFSREVAEEASNFIFSTLLKIRSLPRLTRETKIKIFNIEHHLPFSEKAQLDPQWMSLAPLKKGQRLGSSFAGLLTSPFDGVMVFPRYGELAQSSAELCDIAVEHEVILNIEPNT